MKSLGAFINEGFMPARRSRFGAYKPEDGIEFEIVDVAFQDGFVGIAIGGVFQLGSSEQRKIENYITKNLKLKIDYTVDELVNDYGDAESLNGTGYVYVLGVLRGGKYEVLARIVNGDYEMGVTALK